MELALRENTKKSSIYAVVTRADGSTENLGLISFYHKNPIINFVVNFYIDIKDFLNGRSRSK